MDAKRLKKIAAQSLLALVLILFFLALLAQRVLRPR